MAEKRPAGSSKKYPNLCRLQELEHLGGMSHLIDKSRLYSRLESPYSKKHASEIVSANVVIREICGQNVGLSPDVLAAIIGQNRQCMRMHYVCN